MKRIKLLKRKLISKLKNKKKEPKNVLKEITQINGLDKLKDSFFPEKTFLINMEMRNGFFKTFMIQPTSETFNFLGGLYIIDTDLKYYSVSSKCYCLDFHQDIDLPIKRHIPVNEITTAIRSSGLTEVESATNPSTLARFIESKIAEGIMKGQQIDEYLKKIFIVIIIAALSSVVHLLIFVFKSGMLDSIKI